METDDGDRVGDNSVPGAYYCTTGVALLANPTQFVVILLCAVFVLGANSLNLAVLLTTPSLRNVHGYLLTALTAGGLGLGCLAAVLVYPAWAGCWPYGSAGCTASGYAAHSVLTFNLCVINLLNTERYVAISHPLRYRAWVTRRRTLLAILLTLAVSSAIYALPLATGHMETTFVQEGTACLLTVTGMRGLPVSLAFVCVVMVPSVVIIGMTSLVLLRRLARRSRRLPYLFGSTARRDACRGSPGDGPAAADGSSATQRRNSRLFVVSVLLVLAYLLWWVPFFVVTAMQASQPVVLASASWVVSLSMLLGFFVSPMFNTVIYIFTMDAFKRRVGSLLAGACPCARSRCGDAGGPRGRGQSTRSSRHESRAQSTESTPPT